MAGAGVPLPPEPHRGLRAAHALPRLRVWVAADLGLRRQRLEDAWFVGQAAWRGGGADAAVAFDGVGGRPFGQEAAWAAADAVPAALAEAGDGLGVLRGLDRAACASGGGTTVVGLLAPHGGGPATLLGAGDSSALALHGGRVGLLLPHDGFPPNRVTDFLGAPLRAGHVREVPLAPGGRVLLCTDGFEGLLEEGELAAVLEAPAQGVPAALDAAMEAVLGRGADDNATALLVEAR